MKALFTTIAILAATTFAANSAVAEDAPGALASYKLPVGGNKFQTGYAVAAVVTEDFQKALQTLNAKISALPAEKREAVLAKLDLSILPEYSADLWASKDDYNAYKAAFKETKVQPTQEVYISIQPLGNDEWRLNSVTVDQNRQAAPLTLGALRYNSRSNTWISNNGELTAQKYSTTEDCFYGAQSGTEWKLEKSDEFSQITERVRFTKTADGKYVYISYDFQEKSLISGASIARGGYMLRFEIKK